MKEIPNLTQKQLDRFWSKVDKSGECWEWRAGKEKGGYGVIGINGKSYKSHRISYFIKNNFKNFVSLVCHKCDNPKCVNPDHLFLGSHLDNARDCNLKKRNPQNIPKHPSISSYNRGRCRCFECKSLFDTAQKNSKIKRKYGITGQNTSI